MIKRKDELASKISKKLGSKKVIISRNLRGKKYNNYYYDVEVMKNKSESTITLPFRSLKFIENKLNKIVKGK